jgi:hypothetical protein
MNYNDGENFIKLYETMDRSELTMIKIALKNRGINFRTQFEKTLQIADVYAMGYNGAIIEVEEIQLPEARKVLDEMGISIGSDTPFGDIAAIRNFDSFSKGLPLVGNFDFTTRLLIVGFTVLAILYLLVVVLVEYFSAGKLFL